MEETIIEALKAMISRQTLDLGYARALLRQARILTSTRVAVLVVENLSFFAPLANNICIFLNSMANNATASTFLPALTAAVSYIERSDGLLRCWFEWFWLEKLTLLRSPAIERCLVRSPFLMSRAKYAVFTKDLAWVRARKNEYFQLGPDARRAVLYSVQILPGDERQHWLRGVIAGSPVPLEKWVAEYVLESCAFHEDIPF